MRLESWQRHPHELKFEERHKRWLRKKKEGAGPILPRVTAHLRDRWRGEHHRCHCGCGKSATVWRDREWYNAACVNAGSKWGSSQLPEDRTPPFTRRDKWRINQNSRWLRKEGHES